MSLYKGEEGSEVGDIYVKIVSGRKTTTYLVDSDAAAKLTVRGTTSAPEYAEVEDEIGFTPTEGEPGLTAPDGTTYTINDGEVEADAGSVALLFDGIIEEGAGSTERADALAAKGDAKLGAVGAGRERHYEFKYLDLVDRDNGNVWVKASNDVTVYWPLPEGADASTLKVLHFKGLHREMLPDGVESEIEGCDVEEIEGVTVTGAHVVFEIGEAGFSPFALVWEEKADEPVIVPPTPDDGPDDVVPPMLNGDDHFAYVIGYEDGTVKPNGQITRAEVATIIFRLLDPEVRDANLTTENSFADVSEGAWYNTAVSTLVKLGIISGRSETVFDPNAPITRAEFATLFARFDESGVEAKSTFSDVSTHWARESIELAAALGWINGYEGGTFRPDNRITRAEATTMINRVLNRDPVEDDDLLPDMRTWTDNQPGTWYYFAVQEATNSHEYTRPDAHEDWTEITADPDWTRYQ